MVSTKSQLILDYQGFAENVARKLLRVMGLPQDFEEDMISAGNLGLVEAADRFDVDTSYDFKSFAYLRVRGAIIDSLRKSSTLSGSAYSYARALAALQNVRETDRAEADQREQIGDSRHRLSRVLEHAAKGALAYRLSFDDDQMRQEEGEDGPEFLMQRKQAALLCRELVAELPTKERIIVERYYFRGHSFSEIANSEEGMNKSWVSRLHTRALGRLREMYMGRELNED